MNDKLNGDYLLALLVLLRRTSAGYTYHQAWKKAPQPDSNTPRILWAIWVRNPSLYAEISAQLHNLGDGLAGFQQSLDAAHKGLKDAFENLPVTLGADTLEWDPNDCPKEGGLHALLGL